MQISIFRQWVVVGTAVMLLASGCGQIPSGRAIHKLARKAVEAQGDFPDGAHVSSAKDSVMSVGKNAARVDLFVELSDGSRDERTVWFKRVARTWTIERITPVKPVVAP